MSSESALAACPLIAFVPTTQPTRARDFYQRTLGLRLTEDTPFALVFDANGVMLRVTIVQQPAPAPFTVLGWQVADIDEAVASLTRAGVVFLRYPGMNDSGPSPGLDLTRRRPHRLVPRPRPQRPQPDAVSRRAIPARRSVILSVRSRVPHPWRLRRVPRPSSAWAGDVILSLPNSPPAQSRNHPAAQPQLATEKILDSIVWIRPTRSSGS